ncbi:MAG: DNA-binding response regulator [Anaerolineae bacterium]|nr:MAG: DNA-binding response regulator [Anaerolineae bacterium]WKZ44822.1 MAG: response regulator transcription factor [Anaerolineales bacterium]
MIKILITDDHPIVRSGLRALLSSQSDFEIVGEADNGEEAVRSAISLVPDLILMDLQMPVLDGLGAIKLIREKLPKVNILVLTTYGTDADILPALQAGAIGYLLKDTPPEQLFQAVRNVASGEMSLAPRVAEKVTQRLTNPSKNILSSREIEVLELASQGNPNKEIARKLFITEATVKSHFVHIFSKLEVTDRTAAVTEAVKRKIIKI